MKRILFINDREIHQIGDYVSVCFNTKTRKIFEEGSRAMFEHTRAGKPYIDFCSIRERGNDKIWVDEDNSVNGGLRLEEAQQVVRELQEAIKYMETLA